LPNRQRYATPAQQMRTLLSDGRANGLSFNAGWTTAWGQVRWPKDGPDRKNWKYALDETVEEWRAAYEREPSGISAAVSQLAEHAEAAQFIPTAA
jgi:hypothetical protein